MTGRKIAIFALAAGLALAVAAPASAETVTLGGASASSVGAWVKPTACSQLPVEYAGLGAESYADIRVLDAVTRANVGSAYITSSAPRAGRVDIQVCSFQVEDTSRILLSLAVDGQVADSAPFAWSPKPKSVRCVNKRTYAIKEFTARKCPSGWVKR